MKLRRLRLDGVEVRAAGSALWPGRTPSQHAAALAGLFGMSNRQSWNWLRRGVAGPRALALLFLLEADILRRANRSLRRRIARLRPRRGEGIG